MNLPNRKFLHRIWKHKYNKHIEKYRYDKSGVQSGKPRDGKVRHGARPPYGHKNNESTYDKKQMHRVQTL
jgi:hypothetical protein